MSALSLFVGDHLLFHNTGIAIFKGFQWSQKIIS